MTTGICLGIMQIWLNRCHYSRIVDSLIVSSRSVTGQARVAKWEWVPV